MMSETASLKESMDLIKIKTDKLIAGKENGFLLKDDIWGKGALILKSGVYLTEEIINKLLKFGVKRVNVAIDDLDIEEASIEEQSYLMKQFIHTQSVLIVEKNLINASLLVKKLIDSGFKAGNIFVTKKPGEINSYFRAKQINFLFIDEDLYEICKKCAEKYTLLRNTHAFVMVNSLKLQELKKIGISKIKFLLKPTFEEKLNIRVLEALDKNFFDFWNEDEILIS